MGHEKGGYRNIFINDFAVNEDGSFPIQKVTKKGVEQQGNFKLGEVVPAATFASSRNVAVTNKQTLVSIKDSAYICIKGVEFTGSESEFTAECIPVEGKSLKVNIDAAGGNGTEIVNVEHTKTSRLSAKVAKTSGVHDLYIILPEDCELVSWSIK